jgi:hypothetical protein
VSHSTSKGAIYFAMLRKRRAPSGFIEPCLPPPLTTLRPAQTGFRLMARRDPAGVRLLTRNDNDWSGRYRAIAPRSGHHRQGQGVPFV